MRISAKQFPFRAFRAGAAVLAVLAASSAVAAQIFVAGSDPKADDKNPGTLAAPLRTIQAAVDKAQPGDTVELRAGVYHESVRFKRGGTSSQWSSITLEAYRDEHAVLDGAVAIPAERWKLVAGCKNVYWTPFESQGNRQVNMVFLDGSLILPTLKNIAGANSSLIEGTPSNIMPAMPDDTPNHQGYYHDRQQKKLFVNLGGRVPGKDAQCQPVQLFEAVDVQGQPYLHIRKLEIRNFINYGIFADYSLEIRAEDNYIHHCGSAFWGCCMTGGVVRHNTFADSMGTGMGVGGARGLIVEENVLLRWNLNPYKIVSWGGCGIIANGALGLVLRNNVLADGPDSGVWPDCAGNGITIYGNTVCRMHGDGFYIEAGVYGTILRWNTVCDSGSGITFRENFGNTAFENYLFHNGRALGIGSCDQDNRPKANAMMYNWLIDNGMGAAFGPDLSKEPAHVFDHNVYKFQDWPDVDLRDKKPVLTRIDENVNVGLTAANWPGTNLRSRFCARWTGVIKTQRDGTFKFYINHHECNGARLFIDQQRVTCNREAKVPASWKEREYQSRLKAGDHEIMIEFYHSHLDNLWKGCVLSWEPPGGAKEVIPKRILFHRESRAAELQPGLKAEFFDIAGARMPLNTNGAIILQYGSKRYEDLPSLRAELGQEIHGKVVTKFHPAALGLVTFRLPGAKQSGEPMPMLGNPLPERGDVVAAYGPYFWRKGSFRGVEDYGWYGAGCGFGSETRADGSAFVRMYVTSCHWDIIHQFDDPTAGRPGHMAYLQVGTVPQKTVSSEGFGYWSPDLPTTEGAQIDLSLWVRAKNVKAVGENGGLYTLAEFHNETGQHVTRQYLVGGDAGQKPAGADWMTGDYLYKPLTGTVTAPKGARWFKLGFGLKSCSGWAAFSDVEIKTRAAK
jgi:hypothetical protein